MASSNRNFSVLPTVLLSLVIGTVLGVLLLLMFGGRGKGNADTVSAVNSGVPGTTVVSKDQSGNNSNNNAGTSNSAVAEATKNDTSTSQSGTNADAEKVGTRLSATVEDNHFTGTGQEIYVQACQACHQEGGKGAAGAGIYPPLANNPKMNTAAYPEMMVLFGNGGMPGFGHYLSDEQVAEVVNYVRTELNKNTDKVTPDDIKKLRPQNPDYMIFGEAAG